MRDRSNRRFFGTLAIIVIVLSAFRASPSAQAPPSSQHEWLSVQYRGLIAQYRGGQLDVVRSIANMPPSHLEGVFDVIFGPDPPEGQWTPAELRAAILLHGDAALSIVGSDQQRAGFHVAYVNQMFRKLGLGYRDLAVSWPVALAGVMRARGQLAPAESVLAMARRQVSNAPEVLFASALTAELQASYAATAGGSGTPLQRRTGWLTSADAWLQQTLSLDRSDTSARLHLGRVQMLRQQHAPALETLSALLSDQQQTGVRYLAELFSGAVHDRVGRFTMAEHHYRRATELIPSAPAARVALTELMQRRGRMDEAHEFFRRSIEQAGSESDPWWYYLHEPPRQAEQHWVALRLTVQR